MVSPNTDSVSRNKIVDVENVRKWFSSSGSNWLSGILSDEKYVKAVDDISFDIPRGEIVGLAGQSGCGKSTLGELLAGLQEPTGGTIHFKGEDITRYNKSEMKNFRKDCQVIFQDPFGAMNPRFTVARTLVEPLKIHQIGNREERDARAMEALEHAGLRPAGEYLEKLPSELSGGERQRVLIARALTLSPDFIIADEPVSMLDVSVRTGVLQLFADLQENHDLTILYISHDLSTINYLTDRTMVMYRGNIVEAGSTQDIIQNPSHPYTEALMESVPDPDPDNRRNKGRSEGSVPAPTNLPSGCRYRPNCSYATEKCAGTEPELALRNSEGLVEDTTSAQNCNTSQRQVACYHPIKES